MIYVLVAVCLQVPASSIPLFLQYLCAVRVGLFFAVVWLCDVSARPRAGSDLIDTFISRLAEMIESFFNFENHNGSRQQTQRHVELLWWWASHLRYVVGSTWKDTFEHFTELILLGIPEITELVASTVAGAFLARFGCLLSPTLDNNLWNVQFTCLDKKKASLFLCFSLCFFSLEESKNRVLWRSNLRYLSISCHSAAEIWKIRDSYDAAIPYANSFMIVPSPKSGEVSVSESTMESDGHVDASGTSGCTGEYPHDPQCGICEDVKTLELCPFNAALAWRTLASFSNIFRDANLGGVVLPLVELLGMAQMSVSRWGSLWRHMDRQASRWIRWIRWDKMRYDEIWWDMMRYDEILYLKTMQDVHGIIQFLWLLHLHQMVCSHSPLPLANGSHDVFAWLR